MKYLCVLFFVVSVLSKNPKNELSQKNIFLSIYESLFLKYPKVEVSPEDFITHLGPDSPNYFKAWLSKSLTGLFGMLVYIVPIYLA